MRGGKLPCLLEWQNMELKRWKFPVFRAVLVTVLAVALTACSSSGDEEPELFCDVEAGVISKSDYEREIKWQLNSYADYAGILSVKYDLVNLSIDSYGVEREYRVPESEIRSVLNGRMTTGEIEMYIDSLKNGGNVILFGELTDGSGNIAWFYLAPSA